MLLFGATIAPTNDSARCSLRRNVVLAQSAAIGYLVVVPAAVYLHDYLAVAYPLADGALTVQQSLDANHPSSGSKLTRGAAQWSTGAWRRCTT